MLIKLKKMGTTLMVIPISHFNSYNQNLNPMVKRTSFFMLLNDANCGIGYISETGVG